MSVYSYAEASSLQFEQLLSEAKEEREVIIQSPNGDIFTLRLVSSNEKKILPKKVSKIGVNLSREEIVDYIREVRER
ncbi:MAG: hypothetical protein HQK70_12135 [Desulfamplus sp.]|nr:hypothetical protein [Desulfamplus sp.]